MIPHFLHFQLDQASALANLFGYVSVRSAAAAMTALCLAIFLMPSMIRLLVQRRIGQPIREDGPQSHHCKSGTPTMGGVLVVAAIGVSVMLWAKPANVYVWLCLFVLFSYGAIGLTDDWLKLTRKNSRGLTAKVKLALQVLVALVVSLLIVSLADRPEHTEIIVPFFKEVRIDPGLWGFLILTTLILVGSSNAVNLTDGLDGLAILPTVFIGAALGVFAYVAGHAVFADYLNVPNIEGASELVVVASALVGAGLGFLWFNSYPAQVFMGDVGSLSLGALLAVMAVLVRQELAFFIMAGIYVLETLSVMIQVASYKWLGRRVFKMAPLHHHFEALGIPEPKIVVRFWTLSWVFAILGLMTLKVR